MASYLSLDGLQRYDGKIKQWVKDTAVEQVAALSGDYAPVAALAGHIVQYTGADTTDLKTGYFYTCQEVAATPGTYEWKQINVQPKVDPTSIIDDTKADTTTTYSSSKIDSQIKDNAKDATYKAESSVGAGDGVTIANAIKALEDATSLNYKGTETAAVPTTPADGDLYLFNIPATPESAPGAGDAKAAVIGWKFWSASESAWKELSDDTLSVRVTNLETQVGKDKAINPYESKTDLVDIINILTAADTVTGSVAKLIKDAVAGLEGAMHFVGVITRQTGETDAQAIGRVVPNPASGDVVVMADNAKEYIFVDPDPETAGDESWREVGDEGLYVQKTTTIAGVDLQDNITATELLTALGFSGSGMSYAGIKTAIPTTGKVGDVVLVGNGGNVVSGIIDYKLYVCTAAEDAVASTDAVYQEIAIDSNYLEAVIGTGYEVGPTGAKVAKTVKDYIDSRIFVGTQAEYDAAKTAGTIDDSTFAVITDSAAESLTPIADDDIDALFA